MKGYKIILQCIYALGALVLFSTLRHHCLALSSLLSWLLFSIFVLYTATSLCTVLWNCLLIICSLFSRITFITQFITVPSYKASKTGWKISNNCFQLSCVQEKLYQETLLPRVCIDFCHAVIMEVHYVVHWKGKNFTDFIQQDQFTSHGKRDVKSLIQEGALPGHRNNLAAKVISTWLWRWHIYMRQPVLQTGIVECERCEHLKVSEGLTKRCYQLHLGTKSQDISATFFLSRKSPDFMEL